jgi:hypothetical protein
MAGLYDGLEEAAFKQVSNGYVFTSNCPWLIGPRRRYLVNESQKAEIAECIRQTLRRVKPFVFSAAILIPLVLIGSIFWFATSGATLSVTVVDASGQTTTRQWIGPRGATGTLAGAAGSRTVFTVSGASSSEATVTVQGYNRSGKPGAPAVVPFSAAGTRINMADENGRIIRSAMLVSCAGATSGAVGLFGVYTALIHAYSMARLRPLIAGLPRSNERITFRDGIERFAARVSNKLLVLMGVGAVMPVAANASILTAAIVSHRPIHDLPIKVAACVLAMSYFAFVAWIVIRRVRLKQNAA